MKRLWLYGISSQIPFSFGYHYLLVDVDTRDKSRTDYTKDFLEKRGLSYTWKESPNGFHLYCFERFKFETLVGFIFLIPNVDQKWVQIGANRGYWFLADYEKPFFPEKPIVPQDLTYMRLKIPEVSEWLSMKRLTG